jgi:hypothetical protein
MSLADLCLDTHLLEDLDGRAADVDGLTRGARARAPLEDRDRHLGIVRDAREPVGEGGPGHAGAADEDLVGSVVDHVCVMDWGKDLHFTVIYSERS